MDGIPFSCPEARARSSAGSVAAAVGLVFAAAGAGEQAAALGEGGEI